MIRNLLNPWRMFSLGLVLFLYSSDCRAQIGDTLKVGEAQVVPVDTAVTVDIFLTNSREVAVVDIEIGFDPQVLTPKKGDRDRGGLKVHV